MASRAETARNRALAYAIASAPGLGAFAVAVGQCGFDGAIRVCESRVVPERVQQVWSALGYRIEQMPTGDAVRHLLVGVEVKRRLIQSRKGNRSAGSLAELTKGYCELDEARKGLRVLRSYGATVEEMHSALGAI